MDDTAKKVAQRVLGAAWDNLPDGWTQDSLNQMWESLTGDRKHKVTACLKKMDGKVDDPGAFCASLADKMEPGWRSKDAGSRPGAKGNPAYEALSDAWDKLSRDFQDVNTAIGMLEVISDDPVANRAASKLDRIHRAVLKKSKSWGYTFNTLLEGRGDVDVSRLTKDLDATQKDLTALVKGLSGVKAKNIEDVDDWVLGKGVKAAKDVMAAFDKAIKAFKSNKAASLEDRVASAYLEAQDE